MELDFALFACDCSHDRGICCFNRLDLLRNLASTARGVLTAQCQDKGMMVPTTELLEVMLPLKDVGLMELLRLVRHLEI